MHTYVHTLMHTQAPLAAKESEAADQPIRDKDRIHMLESAVVTWSRQIKNVLKLDPEADGFEGFAIVSLTAQAVGLFAPSPMPSERPTKAPRPRPTPRPTRAPTTPRPTLMPTPPSPTSAPVTGAPVRARVECPRRAAR